MKDVETWRQDSIGNALWFQDNVKAAIAANNDNIQGCFSRHFQVSFRGCHLQVTFADQKFNLTGWNTVTTRKRGGKTQS